MKNNRKKQKGKKKAAVAAATEAAANRVGIPIIGIRIDATTINTFQELAWDVMRFADSPVVYNCECDLTRPFTTKDIACLDRDTFCDYFGVDRRAEVDEQENWKHWIYSARLFVQTQTNFQDIQNVIERSSPDPIFCPKPWSLSPCDNTDRKLIALLLDKDPHHEFLTLPRDYARRVRQHLVDRTGQEYNIYIVANYQKTLSDNIIRVFGLETDYFMAKEVTQGLCNHPMTSLHMVFNKDKENRDHYKLSRRQMGESMNALRAYVGFRVSGLAESNVDELRALVQNVEGPPTDLDATHQSESTGEYVILTHPDCKAEVLQQVNQYLSTSDTVNTQAFPSIYPDGPCLAADEELKIISTGYKAMAAFRAAVDHVVYLNGKGQAKSEFETKATQAVISILVAMKRYPDDYSLHRVACQALYDMAEAKCTAIIAKHGGIQVIISAMKKLPSDRPLQSMMIKIFSCTPMFRDMKDVILACMIDHQSSLTVQAAGLYALRCPSGSNTEDPLSDVTLQKVLRVCVDSMESFEDNAQLQSLGCDLLNYILSTGRHPDRALLVVKAGGAKAVLRVAKQLTLTANPNVPLILNYFLKFADLQQQCFKSVVNMMLLRGSDAPVQEAAGNFLIEAVSEESILPLFEEPGAIGCLGTALSQHPKNPAVLGPCCRALSFLAKKKGWGTFVEGGYTFRSFVAAIGGTHLPDDDHFLHQGILLAIVFLSLTRNETDASASLWASEAGGILAYAGEAMKRHASEKHTLLICFVIIELGFGDGRITLSPVQMHFIGQMIRSMQIYHSDEGFQKSACLTLFELTSKENSGILAKLSKVDVIGRLLQAILKFQHNDEIRNKGGIVVFRVRDFEVANGID